MYVPGLEPKNASRSASSAGLRMASLSLYTLPSVPLTELGPRFLSDCMSFSSNMKWCCRMTSSRAMLREGNIALFKDTYVDPIEAKGK